MTKILFPTDFSETANNAFLYALKLAHSLNAELLVLHVYEMPIISTTSSGEPDLIFDVYDKLEENQFEYYKKHLRELQDIAQKNEMKRVNMNFAFERGILLSIIQRIIDEQNIDFIVMGTVGASGIGKKLLGSNTVNVIRGVKIPVISVPHNARFEGLKKIGFTTLFKDKDIPAMEEVINIAEQLNAAIQVIHVTNTPDDDDFQLKLTEWKNRFSQAFVSFHIIESNDVEGSIFDFIGEQQINILAMVRRNRNFFDRLFGSSFTKKLSYHINEPVMVLHEL
ncbi:universal stress protein [Avrilella dinanensis]|uniref:universal stress protein n=1 Tax=Avrilella dinanensis TaxID=2008672 RepID=UPI002409B083|nr:universal stress protein [Avrilella dinanensis]